jgi:hypothetical protein
MLIVLLALLDFRNDLNGLNVSNHLNVFGFRSHLTFQYLQPI